MSATWLDTSEVVSGLVLGKRISKSTIRPDIFEPSVRGLIKDFLDGLPLEDVYLRNSGIYDVAVEACKNINGSHDFDWVEVLEKSAATYEAGQKLSKISHNMLSGKDVSLATIRDIINNFDEGKTGRKVLSQITPMEIPFVKTGWKAIDDHLGGIPGVGLIIVSGNPGSGKTSWALRLLKSHATLHKDKTNVIYSLEMIDSELAMRSKELVGSGKFEDRIQVNCDQLNVHEVINDAARVDNLGLIIIDFVDYLVKGESTESSVSAIYKELAGAAKELKCPIVILAQYSYKYVGGLPKPDHIRYTSLAKALGWMLICLWNPHVGYLSSEDKEALKSLPLKESIKTKSGTYSQAAALVWKVRGGFREHPNDSPGAIIHSFKGKKGWSPDGRWHHLQNF